MRVPIGAKLLLGFGVVLLLTAAVGALAIYHLKVLSDLTTQLYTRDFAATRHIEDARLAAARFRLATILLITAPDPAERERQAVRRREADTVFRRELSALPPVLVTQEGRSLLGQSEAAWTQYRSVSDQVVAASAAGNSAEADRISRTTAQNQVDAVDALLDQLSDLKNRLAAEAAQQAAQTYETMRNLTLAGLILALIVGIVLARWLASAIGKGLRSTVAVASQIAQGDLRPTLPAHSRDEIGDLGTAFNQMVTGLRDLTGEIRTGVQRLSAATSEILASVTQQGASTTEQAAAVSETTATVDEVRVTAQQASERAQSVALMAQRAAEVASQGQETVAATVAGMQDIRARVESIAEQILALSEQTQQIGEIIATVDGLADQSNLLAVNAAIEASRAGEQGRGFAVVAQEVRTLAERSKTATVQVRTILTDIQRATNAAVLATEQGAKGADEGAKLVDHAGDVIRRLADTIRQSAEAAQQIVASVGQQSVGMDQISIAMTNINQGTNETAAGTRQLQKAAQDLNQLAIRLTGLVERYQLDGRG